jgi:hypothetical protein
MDVAAATLQGRAVDDQGLPADHAEDVAIAIKGDRARAGNHYGKPRYIAKVQIVGVRSARNAHVAGDGKGIAFIIAAGFDGGEGIVPVGVVCYAYVHGGNETKAQDKVVNVLGRHIKGEGLGGKAVLPRCYRQRLCRAVQCRLG